MLSRIRTAAIAVVPLLVLAGCSDTEEPDAASQSAPEASQSDSEDVSDPVDGEGEPDGPPPAAEGDVVVTASNYAFDVPALQAGQRVAMDNTASDEVHELVLVPIAADDDRTEEELLEFAYTSLDAMFAPPPADEGDEAAEDQGTEDAETEGITEEDTTGVLVAPPSASAFLAEGSNELVEGRYIFLCGLPVGGDPAAILAPPEPGQPPAHFLMEGERHYERGMVSVVEVAPA